MLGCGLNETSPMGFEDNLILEKIDLKLGVGDSVGGSIQEYSGFFHPQSI